MQDFRKLKVWEKSHELALRLYEMTERFPQEERYRLQNQIRSSASSIPTNIAEGCGRKSDAEFARFLQVSMGSASELEYQLLLARDLKLIDNSQHARFDGAVTEIKKMIASLIRKLRAES